jgi:two-component system sensor histidine kinase KdpD
MRSRARQLDQRLELGRVEAVSVRGNEALLKEAVLELIENACRHGSNEHPIGISAYSDHHSAFLTVASAGALPQAVATGDSNEPRGVGLTVVRWIASEHGGVLTSERSAGFNLYRLTLASLQNGDSPV